MDKIKENTIRKIRTFLFSDPIVSAKIRLGVAKNIFIFCAFLYFFSLLMTVSGFAVSITSVLAFVLYPIFAFSVLSLVYFGLNYLLFIYLERFLFIRFPVAIGLLVAYAVIVAVHFGLYSFLLSLL